MGSLARKPVSSNKRCDKTIFNTPRSYQNVIASLRFIRSGKTLQDAFLKYRDKLVSYASLEFAFPSRLQLQGLT